MASVGWRRALVALVVATACASDGGSGARVGRRVPRVSWTNSSAHWVTQPVAVAGRLVAYMERDGLLSVAALDATTGEIVWEYAASASLLTRGVGLNVANDGQRVYFGMPVDPGLDSPSVFVVAVEAFSGAKAWQTTTPLELADGLYLCGDDTGAFCVVDYQSPGTRALRIARADGNVTRGSDPTEAPEIGRALGAGLHDLGVRNPERIAAVDSGGNILWARTVGELFQGRPVSSDLGYSWYRYGDVIVGSLGWIDPDRSTVDLSEAVTAGVDAATGASRWIVDGAELGCGVLLGDFLVSKPIRCRTRGVVTNDADDTSSVAGLEVVMERFDPATGATQWQADLGAAVSLVLATAPVSRLSPTEIAVGREDGTSIVVDIDSGTTRAPTADDVGWCESENTYVDNRTRGDERRGDDYVTQCRPDGSRVDGLVASPIEAGARLGQTFVWADESGMHAAATGWVTLRRPSGR